MTSRQIIQEMSREQLESAFSQREAQLAIALKKLKKVKKATGNLDLFSPSRGVQLLTSTHGVE